MKVWSVDFAVNDYERCPEFAGLYATLALAKKGASEHYVKLTEEKRIYLGTLRLEDYDAGEKEMIVSELQPSGRWSEYATYKFYEVEVQE